jgi:UDP-N-acetylmuramate--alanine ligase
LIACADDRGVRRLLAEVERLDIDILTYGLEENGEAYDLIAADIRSNQLGGSDFVLLAGGETLGLARLALPGKHNVRNALAAIAVCRTLGVPFGEMHHALADFGGVGRRFQVVGEVRDVTVVDDYAHHPTEIRATLAAARQRYAGRRLWAVWQPHTFSRTKLLAEEFAASFDEADRVIVLDIYPSREQDSLGVDSGLVVSRMTHERVQHIGDEAAAAQYILDRIRPGDVLLTLGAGDGDRVGRRVLAGLEERQQS